MAELIYDFSHEVGSDSFEIKTSSMMTSVRYVGASKDHQETASSTELWMRNIFPGVSVLHKLEPYIISSEFEIDEVHDAIDIALSFSSAVTLRNTVPNNPGIVGAIDSMGNTVMSMIASKVSDDTGMKSPAVIVTPLGEGAEWRITISIDDAWQRESSRVFPFRFSLDYSLSPSSKALGSITMSSIDNETVLYQDTRPDSATMFAVYFCDDSQLKRERMMKDGRPVCSTIPHIEGDTWDLTPADFERHDSGYGYDTRRVWLEIISSKPIASDKPVYYDVIPAGSVKYLGNIAERIGYIGDLPIFRGSFLVTRQAPPSFLDGTGVVRAYIIENREKDIPARIRVIGSSKKTMSSVIRIIGTKKLSSIGAIVNVVNNKSTIGSRVNVISNKGLNEKSSRVWVLQTVQDDDFITDGKFYFPDTLATRWEQPSLIGRDYAGSVSQVWNGGGYSIKFVPIEASDTNAISANWYSEIGIGVPFYTYGIRVGSQMSLIRLADVPLSKTYPAIAGNISVSLKYMHLQISPPDGYEWDTEESSTGFLGIHIEGDNTVSGTFSGEIAMTTAPVDWILSSFGWNGMQKPSYDLIWNNVSINVPKMWYDTIGPGGTTTLGRMSIMFAPSYGMLRLKTYPYSYSGPFQKANLYIDDISARIG